MKIITRTLTVALVLFGLSAFANQFPITLSAPTVYHWWQSWSNAVSYMQDRGGNHYPTLDLYAKSFDIWTYDPTITINRQYYERHVTAADYHQDTEKRQYRNDGYPGSQVVTVTDTLTTNVQTTTSVIYWVDATPQMSKGTNGVIFYDFLMNTKTTLSVKEDCWVNISYSGGMPGNTYWYRVYFGAVRGEFGYNSQVNLPLNGTTNLPASSLRMGYNGAYPVVDASNEEPGACYALIPFPARTTTGYVNVTPTALGVPYIFFAYGRVVLDHVTQDSPPEQ